MRNITLFLCLVIAVPFALSAQTDSSRLDVGYLSLNKHFTQSITIRGEDLEKMPVVNLSDALRPWLFGTFTGAFTIAYVVDGNPVSAVDLYPVYEIAEVTLVLNAVGSAAYGNGQQELVLVTTKRGKGAAGMRVAAQTGVVDAGGTGAATNTGMYHQYYLEAYHQTEKFSFGASAGWQRDFYPNTPSSVSNVYTPANLQRWRLNGWMEWRPDPKNTIGLRLGYVSQHQEYADSAVNSQFPSKYSVQGKDHLLIPQLSWEGRLSRGLRNRFDAEYLNSRFDWTTDQLSLGASSIPETDHYQVGSKNSQLVFRDRLVYETQAGRWRVSPSLDLSYQHIDERTDNSYFTVTNFPVLYTSTLETKANLFYLTPAVDLSLAKAFDIQVGTMLNGSSKVQPGTGRLYPFVTATVDLLHLNEASSGGSLNVYGSYARRTTRYIDDYSQNDLVGAGSSQKINSFYLYPTGYSLVNGQPFNPGGFVNSEPGYWTWAAGFGYSTANGRVSLHYQFERRNMSLMLSDYNNANLLAFEPIVENFQHLDLRVKLIDSKTAVWLTGITVNLMRGKADTTGLSSFGIEYYAAPVGDNPPAHTWTGGWVNRLTVGRWSAGLDLLYHFGMKAMGLAGPFETLNPVVVPTIYAGYQWKAGTGTLDLFVQASGVTRYGNLSMTDIPDNRRFITIGGSWTL